MSDFEWFIKNYNDLFRRYGHKFLVIKNQKVIGVYNSAGEAVRNTPDELGTYIVQECNGNESAYTNYISSLNFA